MPNTESEFARRVADIHSKDGTDKDIRHEELQAMFDTFLGPDFDANRRRQVEQLQIQLFQRQTRLEKALTAKRISAEKYVDSFNSLLTQTFHECEKTLGTKDFAQLFGAPTDKLGGYIDKAAFLEQARPKTSKKLWASTARKASAGGSFMRPVQPDDKLAAVVGSKPLPRSELTKKLWNYIKKHGLRDKKKKTQIHADDSLRAVFDGKSQVSLREMAKLVSRHLR
jgi:chromatin remodeling complex protein RSC6